MLLQTVTLQRERESLVARHDASRHPTRMATLSVYVHSKDKSADGLIKDPGQQGSASTVNAYLAIQREVGIAANASGRGRNSHQITWRARDNCLIANVNFNGIDAPVHVVPRVLQKRQLPPLPVLIKEASESPVSD